MTLCWLGMGVWGLVAASYLSLVVWIAVTWTLARWRPRRGLASVKVWRELARYGIPLLIGGAVDEGRTSSTPLSLEAFSMPRLSGTIATGLDLGCCPAP